MSEVETRTREALHDVVDGLDVTDADVSRMEAELFDSLHGRRSLGSRLAAGPSRGRWGLAVASVAAGASLVAGGYALGNRDSAPVQPASAPGEARPLFAPELVGLWRNVPDSPWLWEFTDDGRMGFTDTTEGYLAGKTVSLRLTARAGDVYTVPMEGEPCGRSTNRIRLTAPDVVTVTGVDSCDGSEDGADLHLTLSRVSPGPAGAAALAPLHASGPPVPVSRVSQLHGAWLHVESGTLLAVGYPEVGEDLTYVIDDDGDGSTDPDQRGLLSVEADGSVVPSPFAADQVHCGPRFTSMTRDSVSLTTVAAANGCFPEGSRQRWVRVND